MNDKQRVYGTNNVGHCWSRTMYFNEWMQGLEETQRRNFDINGFTIEDFMLGDSRLDNIKEKIFYHLPMPCHLLIKHKNHQKIDSHKWFFKGFCERMNPTFAQIIDCGSIAMPNSISHLVKYLAINSNVGG